MQAATPREIPRRSEDQVADRRAGRVPHVPDEHGGQQPRARNQDGTWRKKRSDAGKPRKTNTKKSK